MFEDNDNNFTGPNNGVEVGNAINLLGIMLGYENLMENRLQSRKNNIQEHNQKQAKVILEDLHKQFESQNELLYYQNKLLEEILFILKGEK